MASVRRVPHPSRGGTVPRGRTTPCPWSRQHVLCAGGVVQPSPVPSATGWRVLRHVRGSVPRAATPSAACACETCTMSAAPSPSVSTASSPQHHQVTHHPLTPSPHQKWVNFFASSTTTICSFKAKKKLTEGGEGGGSERAAGGEPSASRLGEERPTPRRREKTLLSLSL